MCLCTIIYHLSPDSNQHLFYNAIIFFSWSNINIFNHVYKIIKKDIDEVLNRYQDTLKPMHLQFIEPTKNFADIIIPNNKRNTVAIDVVRTVINDRL